MRIGHYFNMTLAAALLWCDPAGAHFSFVIPAGDGATAQIIMSETLEPEDGLGVELLKDLTLFMRSQDGSSRRLTINRLNELALEVESQGSGTRLIYGSADLGVMERGSTPHHLIYYPKSIIGDPFAEVTLRRDGVPIEIVPVLSAGRNDLQLRLLVNGLAKPGSEITVIDASGNSEVIKTDDTGLTPTLQGRGRFAAWARYWEDKPGVHEGKNYLQIRHYATLVFDVAENGSEATDLLPESSEISVDRWIDLPIGAASFGAVASQGWLYVYGGHTAIPHEYHTNSSSGGFWRLDLGERQNWEALPGGVALQGMNLAAVAGKIVLVGGMRSLNEKGDPAANRSVPDCAAFDLSTMQWSALPPLPVPRSSHDVVAIGQKLYVLGGWNMRLNEAPVWQSEMLELDLASQDPQWVRHAQPFQRRALIAAALDHRIYVMGGFNESNKPSRRVEVYDTRTKRWSEGPDLPGGLMNGFAPAACVHDGRLALSLGDGTLVRLTDDGNSWQQTAETTPRIVHRMVSFGSRVLVMGGASDGDVTDLIEVVTIPTSLQSPPVAKTPPVYQTSHAHRTPRIATDDARDQQPRRSRMNSPAAVRVELSEDPDTIRTAPKQHPVALGQKTCPIMTSRRVDDDSPVAMYHGRPVALCCETCLAKWEKDPDSYAAVADLPQLDGLVIPQRGIEQVFCPVFPDRVVSANDPSVEYRGRKVYLFNQAALRRWNKNPDNYLDSTILPQLRQDPAGD